MLIRRLYAPSLAFCSDVRDAAGECVEELFKVIGPAVYDIISRHSVRPSLLRDLYERLKRVHLDDPAAAQAAAEAADAAARDQRVRLITESLNVLMIS